MLNFNDIVYKKDINKIDNWINSIDNKNISNVLIIKGAIGCGKTTLCNLIEEKYITRFKFFTFDTDYQHHKTTINNIIKQKHVLSMFKQQNIRKGLILDNIKSSSAFLKSIVKYKKNYFNYPIIILTDNEFNEDLNFKFTKLEIKQKTFIQLSKIYKNYKMNTKILNNILKKSYGDFNFINKTLYFIKLSPKITFNDVNHLKKDVNLNNYFLLLKFINSKIIYIEEYDYNFIVYLFKNIYNIVNILNVNYNYKKKNY